MPPHRGMPPVSGMGADAHPTPPASGRPLPPHSGTACRPSAAPSNNATRTTRGSNGLRSNSATHRANAARRHGRPHTMNDHRTAETPSRLSERRTSRSASFRLHAADVEAIAVRVAELLRGGEIRSTGLVDAATLAKRLGVSRSWVYEHAVELGAKRLGGGAKPRLRFDVAEAERLASCVAGRESAGEATALVKPRTARRRASVAGTTVPLLPVRGASRVDANHERPQRRAA